MDDPVIQSILSASFLAAILRVTTPILLPSLGALLADRAGVINVGLEGMMLSAAFTGVVVSAYSQGWFGAEAGQAIGPWLGLLLGIGVSMLMALLLGFFHLRLKADLILSGLAINILGASGTVAIMYELTGDRGNTSTLASLSMPFVPLPTFINDIPLVGGFVYNVFDNQSIMTWIAFIAVFLVAFLLYRTPFGTHLRASGENPAAAESVGIPVQRTRYIALMLSGMFAGLGGIHMSMGYLEGFQRDMTAGRGFIALATPLLGGSNPYGTGGAALIFGFFDALSTRIGSMQIPSQLPQTIPYVATIMALVIYALQTRLTLRIRALRAAEGKSFKAAYWRSIQRLSTLHMMMAMVALIGIIVSICIFAAPDGFGGREASYPAGIGITLVSVVLIAINLPFLLKVERIGQQVYFSAGATAVSSAVYLGLFLGLFFSSLGAVAGGIVLGLLMWIILGGWQLSGIGQRAKVMA